jgi:hypothetical protein
MLAAAGEPVMRQTAGALGLLTSSILSPPGSHSEVSLKDTFGFSRKHRAGGQNGMDNPKTFRSHILRQLRMFGMLGRKVVRES